MIERALFVIKPDSVQCRQEIAIKKFMSSCGFKLENEKIIVLSELQSKIICKKYKDEYFFDDLIFLMTGGASIVFTVCGESIVEKLKMNIGDFCPAEAESGTLRNIFINSLFLFDGNNPAYNSVIFSEDSESAEREISIAYGETE